MSVGVRTLPGMELWQHMQQMESPGTTPARVTPESKSALSVALEVLARLRANPSGSPVTSMILRWFDDARIKDEVWYEGLRIRRAQQALELLEFGEANPGVEFGKKRPIAWISGEECSRCHGHDPDLDGPDNAGTFRCGQTDACKYRIRATMFTRQDGKCGYCEEALNWDLHQVAVDHIIPRERYGTDEPWNKQLVHVACNSRKGERITFRARLLAEAHGVVIPDFIPVRAATGEPGDIHLIKSLISRKALCNVNLGKNPEPVSGRDGDPQLADCAKCQLKRSLLGPGTVYGERDLPISNREPHGWEPHGYEPFLIPARLAGWSPRGYVANRNNAQPA